MTAIPNGTRVRPSAGARFWAIFPWAVVGANLLGFGFMVSVAVDDPGFSVEENYYEKAVKWDEHQQQLADNVTLGWQLEPELTPVSSGVELRVKLADRHGAPVPDAQLSLETFHVARGQDVLETELVEHARGDYRARLPMRRAGIWELRFTAIRGADRFTHVDRQELTRGPS